MFQEFRNASFDRRIGTHPLACLACTILVILAVLWSPYGATARTQSLQGRFLVATSSMPDPRFKETVIFMARHSARGALGFVINKPLAVGRLGDLADKLGTETSNPDQEMVLHYGGPVRPNLGSLLHSPDYSGADSETVTDWASFSQSNYAMEALVAGRGPKQWLLALGYSGWGPGQLERELTTGSWFVVDADAKLLFEDPLEERWRRALELRGIDL